MQIRDAGAGRVGGNRGQTAVGTKFLDPHWMCPSEQVCVKICVIMEGVVYVWY
jgi:hypothetical protein